MRISGFFILGILSYVNFGLNPAHASCRVKMNQIMQNLTLGGLRQLTGTIEQNCSDSNDGKGTLETVSCPEIKVEFDCMGEYESWVGFSSNTIAARMSADNRGSGPWCYARVIQVNHWGENNQTQNLPAKASDLWGSFRPDGKIVTSSLQPISYASAEECTQYCEGVVQKSLGEVPDDYVNLMRIFQAYL